MKSQTSLIALLTFTALILCVMLFITPARNTARADILAPAGNLTLLTSQGYTQFGYVAMLNIVDERDGLLLTYYLDNEQLQLLGVYNLASQTNPPPLQ
ncbi:MAG TPA: hypothetical protein VMG59_11075 [Phycisphaerae bacterium]|nr:hypothetical protein [Phycisphaerae bacterium]